MITSEKSHQYRVAGVATALVALVAFVFGAIGIGLNVSMTSAQETPATTMLTTQSAEEAPPITDLSTMPCEYFNLQGGNPYEPCTDPCSDSYTRHNDIPYYYIEECLHQYGDRTIDEATMDPDANSNQMALPVFDPLEIPILQEDGEVVGCKRGTISLPTSADGRVVVNDNLIGLSTDGAGDLTLSPYDADIEPERIAIVVNDTRAAWLPATAAGSRITMTTDAWLPDVTMWWRLQICAISG